MVVHTLKKALSVARVRRFRCGHIDSDKPIDSFEAQRNQFGAPYPEREVL